MIHRKFAIITFILVLVIGLVVFIEEKDRSPSFEAQDKETLNERDRKSIDEEKTAVEGFGVSAADPLAVRAGMEVLRAGGNAIDAAIAVSYVLSVVEPFGSGLGGGGAMLVVPGDGDSPVAYDYREMAPTNGKVSEGYIGVPGFVKGLERIHDEHGSLSIEELLQPAIDLAENGFQVNSILTERLQAASGRLPVRQLEHFYPDGSAIKPGKTLYQPELARSLKMIQQEGADAFYKGEIGKKIAESIEGLNMADMNDYTVSKNDPVEGIFNGYQVYSVPPPFSGLTVIQTLQMAEFMGIGLVDSESVDFIHLLAEISIKTYESRVKHIGDLNFNHVPIKELSSVDYAKELSSDIFFNQLSTSFSDDTLAAELDHSDTTHFVIYDENGTMVSATHSLSNFFGSGKYLEGFFLNNQLMNFSQVSSSPNSYEPGKRPRSFTAPTILVKDNQPVIGIGSPGGKRIPVVISHVLILFLLHDIDFQTAIDAPRFFVEEGTLFIEDRIPDKVKEELIERDFDVVIKESPVFFGGVQGLTVHHDINKMSGGADPRRNGTWEIMND